MQHAAEAPELLEYSRTAQIRYHSSLASDDESHRGLVASFVRRDFEVV